MDAFDADVLIYAADLDHELGNRVLELFRPDTRPAGVGSTLLLTEVLVPRTDGRADEIDELGRLLERLDLRTVDRRIAEAAAILRGKYRLKTADAVHLATALDAGADRFITNNARDFPKTITEIDITYPTDLPDPVT